jgi:hypothetical protein
MSRYYGCCANMPESMLHTGDRQDYPQWYINYLLGVGDAKLHHSAKKILTSLSDGSWYNKFDSHIGVMSLEACIELELVERHDLTRANKDGYWTKFKITERGKEALKKQSLPQ